MADVCGFCGRGGVTKEHLWPDWLRKVILQSRTGGSGKLFNAEIEREGKVTKFTSASLEMTVGMPCGKCNHGWMSQLENAAKPFMTAMVDTGEKTLLTRERQTILARWAIKTAMVHEYTAAASQVKYFSARERLAFKERFEIPESLWIWAGRYDGIRPIHAVETRGRAGRVGAPGVYALTLGANFLVVQVFSYRASEGDLSAYATNTRNERLLRIWPTSAEWLTWPPPTTIDDDALNVLDHRFVNVLSGSTSTTT